MKRFLLIALVFLSFSCENKKKNNQKSTTVEEVKRSSIEKEPEIINSLILPGKNLWLLNRITFNESDLTEDGLQSYNVARTSIDETAYTMVPDIPINYGSKYRLIIMAKRGINGHFLGLRAVGQYPNRIDAVFDLKNGLVKEIKNSGEFVKGNASITPIGNGWYKCSIVSELDTDLVKLIFGPTNESIRTVAWESQAKELLDIHIVPSSLILEEISD